MKGALEKGACGRDCTEQLLCFNLAYLLDQVWSFSQIALMQKILAFKAEFKSSLKPKMMNIRKPKIRV